MVQFKVQYRARKLHCTNPTEHYWYLSLKILSHLTSPSLPLSLPHSTFLISFHSLSAEHTLCLLTHATRKTQTHTHIHSVQPSHWRWAALWGLSSHFISVPTTLQRTSCWTLTLNTILCPLNTHHPYCDITRIMLMETLTPVALICSLSFTGPYYNEKKTCWLSL